MTSHSSQPKRERSTDDQGELRMLGVILRRRHDDLVRGAVAPLQGAPGLEPKISSRLGRVDGAEDIEHRVERHFLEIEPVGEVAR